MDGLATFYGAATCGGYWRQISHHLPAIKGKHVNISVGDAVKLARALGTTVEVLVDGPLPPVPVEDAIQRVTELLVPPE